MLECTAFASFRQDVPKVNLIVPHQQRAFPFKNRISIKNVLLPKHANFGLTSEGHGINPLAPVLVKQDRLDSTV